MMHRLPLLFALATAALAQKPPDANAFVPQDYRCECTVDFQALEQHEMLDGLRRSALGMLFSMAEQQLGFAFGDLKRLRAYPEVPADGDAEGKRYGAVAIFEGNHNIGLPNPGQLDSYKADKLAGTPVLIEQSEWSRDDPGIYASPADGLMVIGASHLVRPVLEGKSKPAVPPPDFQSLTSGRGSLAHVVMALSAKALQEIPFVTPDMWSAEDPPKFLMLRLRIEPAADGGDESVLLEAVVRCTGKQGPEVVAKTVRDALAAAEKHPRLGALKHLWKKIELKTDGIDVVAHMALGRPRDAAGSLGLMLGPLMLIGTTTAQPVMAVPAVQVVPAVEAPAPTEKPKDPPKGEGKGNG